MVTVASFTQQLYSLHPRQPIGLWGKAFWFPEHHLIWNCPGKSRTVEAYDLTGYAPLIIIPLPTNILFLNTLNTLNTFSQHFKYFTAVTYHYSSYTSLHAD